MPLLTTALATGLAAGAAGAGIATAKKVKSEIVSAELNAFYNLPSQLGGKSVQPAWRFYVAHIYNPMMGVSNIGDVAKRLLEGPSPLMRAYHVKNVSVPTYQFNKEIQEYGAVPRSFAVLNANQGLNLQLTYEEDDKGTIGYLVNWMQRRTINRNGYYNAPMKTRMMIIVEAHDQNGVPNAVYIFHDCFYTLCGEAQYSYDSNAPMSYAVSYGFDRMSVSFPKYSLIGSALNIANGINILKG